MLRMMIVHVTQAESSLAKVAPGKQHAAAHALIQQHTAGRTDGQPMSAAAESSMLLHDPQKAANDGCACNVWHADLCAALLQEYG